jgi:hypothetical protein
MFWNAKGWGQEKKRSQELVTFGQGESNPDLLHDMGRSTHHATNRSCAPCTIPDVLSVPGTWVSACVNLVLFSTQCIHTWVSRCVNSILTGIEGVNLAPDKME